MLMMPVVGFLIGRADPRWLIMFGFTILATSLVWMHSLSLASSFKYIMWLRVYQSSGLAFLFIPINTISYTGVARSENNDVSGLTNLARNIGGSVGTAFVATTLARASQRHESNMIRNLTPSSAAFVDQVNQLKGAFHGGSTGAASMFGGGSRGAGGVQTAQAFIYNQLHQQAAMLSYLDIISFFAAFCAIMVPLVIFMVGKIKPAADAPVHINVNRR